MRVEGTKIGLFGFTLFAAYDVDSLSEDTPLAKLLWKSSGENIWHSYQKDLKVLITQKGNLSINLNGRHFQKFKGKFFVSIYLKRPD